MRRIMLNNFRDNLRRIVAERELSKTGLAARAGIHRVTLHKLLAGEFDPSLDLCERLSDALGFLRPEDIFKKSSRRGKKTA